MSVMKNVINVLKTPVPLPRVLTTPIELPVLSAPLPFPHPFGKKKGRAKRKSRIQAPNLSERAMNFSLDGPLQAGDQSLFAVNGHDIHITADTWIFGELKVGVKVKVKGVFVNGTERQCTSVVVRGLS